MTDKRKAKASNSAYLSTSNVVEPTSVIAPPWYYKLLIKLLKPLYRAVLWRRHNKAIKNKLPLADYKLEIDTRFGRQYPEPPIIPNSIDTEQNANLNPFHGANIWCHAVSLGETNTIAPMLKVMLQQGAKLWVTNTTQTGFARTEALFAEAINSRQMVHTFVPVDDQAVITTFIETAKPDLAMFVETELWANILAVLKKFAIPSVLVNARLSQKSYESYAKYESVSKSMMHNITMIIAQDADSAKRFRRLGTEVVKIRLADSLKWSTGTSIALKTANTNFYQSTSNANTSNSSLLNAGTATDIYSNVSEENESRLLDKFSAQSSAINRPIWVAGSTHEGEEKAVIEAHKQLISQSPLTNALLVLVPRHPERFDGVADLLEQSGLVYTRRSNNQLIEADTQVYLADTMGELISCYELSDIALVGGSLVNIGGHNPIEAASLAKPIIMGPFTQSCHEVVADLEQVGALKVVAAIDNKAHKKSVANESSTGADLVKTVVHWLSHPEIAKQSGKLGQQLVNEKSDAMRKQLAMIESLLRAHQTSTTISSIVDEELDMDYFKVREREPSDEE